MLAGVSVLVPVFVLQHSGWGAVFIRADWAGGAESPQSVQGRVMIHSGSLHLFIPTQNNRVENLRWELHQGFGSPVLLENVGLLEYQRSHRVVLGGLQLYEKQSHQWEERELANIPSVLMRVNILLAAG